MEEHAYIGELLTAIFYLIIGLRLLRLASQTRQPPERLLGTLFLCSGVSYLAYVSPMIFQNEALWTPMNFAGRLLYLPVPVFLAAFTRQVFRPNSRWAVWCVWLCLVVPVAGVTGSALSGDLEGYSLGNPGFWAEWAGYTIPFAWAGAESFLQYARARRRRQHGLCDPMVCNRFLLWGIYGVLTVIVSLLVLPMYAHFERHGQFAAIWDRLIGVCEMASIATIWLVFFAPAFYRRWIEDAATQAEAVAEH
jgi:uncharacterized membrane protein SirB2